MKTHILLGFGALIAATSVAAAQTSVPGYPDAKVIPVDASPAAKHESEGIRRKLTDNLTGAGYTNVKIAPEAFIVQATDKKGEPVVMFLTPDSLTVFTAMDNKGQDARTAPSAPPPAAVKK
jgi:hypothetical protein